MVNETYLKSLIAKESSTHNLRTVHVDGLLRASMLLPSSSRTFTEQAFVWFKIAAKSIKVTSFIQHEC